LKRIKRNCTDDPLDRICAMSAEQCNALNCYDAATEAIVVRVGKFGTISLSLCQRCAETKFQTRVKTTRVMNQFLWNSTRLTMRRRLNKKMYHVDTSVQTENGEMPPANSNIKNDNLYQRKSSSVRTIKRNDVLRATKRHDRFLSLLNENESTLLAGSKIAARVEVSEAQWTKEKLIDMIFQNLAEVHIIVEYNGETLQIPKYSEVILVIIVLWPKISFVWINRYIISFGSNYINNIIFV
jgi:hypothetical protein